MALYSLMNSKSKSFRLCLLCSFKLDCTWPFHPFIFTIHTWTSLVSVSSSESQVKQYPNEHGHFILLTLRDSKHNGLSIESTPIST